MSNYHQIGFTFGDEPLHESVVLHGDPRWDECVQEFKDCKAFGFDIETYGVKKDHGLDPFKGFIRLVQIGLLSGRVLVLDLGQHDQKVPLPVSLQTIQADTPCRIEFDAKHPWVTAPSEKSESYTGVLNLLREKLLDQTLVIGHNLEFDIRFMRTTFGWRTRHVRDTMLMSEVMWAIGGEGQKYKNNLGAVCDRLRIEIDKSEQKSDWAFNLTNRQINYAARDTQASIEAAKKLKAMLVEEGIWESALIECNAVPAFAEMMIQGMPVQESILQETYDAYVTARDEIIQPFLQRFPGVNPRSSQVVNQVLSEEFGLELNLSKGGTKAEQKKRSDFNSRILRQNEGIPEIKSLLEFRSINQPINYMEMVQRKTFGGAARGKYDQLAPRASGRSSCGKDKDSPNPSTKGELNLQNPAKHLPYWKGLGLPDPRAYFRAPDDMRLIIADLSQAHARISCEVSQDETMIKAYNNGEDTHNLTASNLLVYQGKNLTPDQIGEYRKGGHPDSVLAKSARDLAKKANYAFQNGSGPATFQGTLQKDKEPIEITLAQAKEAKQAWEATYPRVSEAQKRIYEESNVDNVTLPGLPGKYGKIVGLSGRRIYFRKHQREKRNRYGESYSTYETHYSEVLSNVWLTTEADVVKGSMWDILLIFDQHPEWDARLGNMSHDEINVWCKKEYAQQVAEVVDGTMERWMKKYIKSIPVQEFGHKPSDCICQGWNEK